MGYAQIYIPLKVDRYTYYLQWVIIIYSLEDIMWCIFVFEITFERTMPITYDTFCKRNNLEKKKNTWQQYMIKSKDSRENTLHWHDLLKCWPWVNGIWVVSLPRYPIAYNHRKCPLAKFIVNERRHTSKHAFVMNFNYKVVWYDMLQWHANQAQCKKKNSNILKFSTI